MFQKEEVSRNKGVKPIKKEPEKLPKDEYELDEETEKDASRQITNFEYEMFGADSDSD